MIRTKIHTFLFIVLLMSALPAETIIPGGDISGTWIAENSPYIIQNNCTIIDLTIEAGVEVQFAGKYKFEVSGKLMAQGFYSDSIIFKPTVSNTAGWFGIKFRNMAELSSALSYCRIEGASDKGAIQIDQIAPDILSNCRILNNQSDGLYIKNASLEIHNCIISSNTMNGVLLDGGQLTAVNSIISTNTLAGITATHTDDSALLTNSVITNNGTDGITATDGLVTVQNSIIYGNQTSVNGTAQATYSCIEGDSVYPGTGNINDNPQFRDSLLYELGPQSACIDSGTIQILQSDRYFPPSKGGIRNDMGAYGGPGAGKWYPPIYIVPQSYDFGNVTLDSSRSVTVNAYNYRDVPISTVLITFLPGNPAVFSSDFTPLAIPVLGSAPIELTFTPAAVQSYSADMVVLTSDQGTVSIPVRGVGVVADIDSVAKLLEFGAVSTDDSLTLPLQIRNTGTDTLRLSVQPPSLTVFTISQSEYTILPDSGTASIPVKFKPIAIKDYQDSIAIYSNDPDENPVLVNLTGTGSAARLDVEPDSLDFDSVSIGDFADDSLTVLNSGNSDLVITEIKSDNAPFTVLDPPPVYPLTVVPGNSLKLKVRFTPTAIGFSSGNVIITSNSIENESKIIPVSGTGTGSQLMLSASTLDYGNVPLFSDSVQQIILHSTGNEPVVVEDIFVENITADSVFTLINSDLLTPLTLFPGQDTTLSIRYEARNIGSDSGRAEIVCQNPDLVISVILSGTGRAPVVSSTRDSLNFGGIYIPFDSVQTITLRNSGNSELIVQSYDFAGQSPDSTVFEVVNQETTPPFAILPGDSVNLGIRFKPLYEGVVTTDLIIQTNDPQTPELTISLSGTGLMSSLLLSDAHLDFGSVKLYAKSKKIINLTNKGNTPIVIQDLVIEQETSDFKIVDTSFVLPITLDPEEMLELILEFTPSQIGLVSGELTITSNTPGLENIAVDLNGTGRGAVIKYTPSTLNFRTVLIGREKESTLEIRNIGNDTLIINNIQFAEQDPDSMEFDTVTIQLPISVLPDSSALLKFVFRPMQENLVTSFVDIYSNDPDSSVVRVGLSGTGILSAPILFLDQTEIDFGEIQVTATGNAVLSIKNTGNENLTIYELRWFDSNPDTVFKLATPVEIPFSVKPENYIDLTIQFSPNREGLETGYLRITSDDPATSQDSVLLKGMGIPPYASIYLATTTLDFGRVFITEDSLLTVSVNNIGHSDLEIPVDSLRFIKQGDNNFELGNKTDLVITPDDSGSILVYYKPQTRGLHSNTLRVVSNDPEHPVQNIYVSGEGYVDETAQITFDPLNSSASFVKGQPGTISFIITNVIHVDSAFIYLKEGGAVQYTQLPLTAHINGQNWYRQISANMVSERGLQYYVCVYHNYESTLFPEDGALEPLSIQVVVPEQQFPQSTPRESYQLISIPLETGNLNISSLNIFGDDLGPYDNTKYRLFDIVNGTSYLELSSMNKSLPPGKAVWLITKNPTALDVSNAQSVSTADNFPLTLSEGWNLVGSPFAFYVDWSTVSEEFKLRDYTGSGWGFTDLLSPYEGCAVYVPRDTVLFLAPIETAAGVTKPLVSTEAEDDWHIRISAVSRNFDDIYNYAGVKAVATDQIDNYDYPEPPVIGDYVSLYFCQPDGQFGYSTDYRHAGADGYIYKFELHSSYPGEKKIILDSENLPAYFEWAVVSMETQTYFRDHTITISAKSAQFMLITGLESYVNEQVSGLSALPTQFNLTQNFPNPFNPKTKIRYQLPVPTDVSINIFNILGQKIRTLVSGVHQEAGTYEYEWDGFNDQGQTAASGIYILQFSTKEYKRTIKMLLQK